MNKNVKVFLSSNFNHSLVLRKIALTKFSLSCPQMCVGIVYINMYKSSFTELWTL